MLQKNLLKSIPMKASIKEQMDIFSNKHTWFCTVTYVMTFGTFAGFGAVDPEIAWAKLASLKEGARRV